MAACHGKGVSSVHCRAIPSESRRIQSDPHQHAAFVKRNVELRNLEQTYTTLAENEEWIALNIDKTIQRRKDHGDHAKLAEEEEQILNCLGDGRDQAAEYCPHQASTGILRPRK